LRYTRFHTTALCSPTRAALLTGRNHHSAGTGTITELGDAYPGYSGQIPASAAMVSEVLRQNGYGTAWFGKNHNVPDWETSISGPYDRWPTRQGFDHFYGFIGGEANQWAPALYHDNSPIEMEVPKGREADYTLNESLADEVIKYINKQKSVTPDRPFFIYYAPGAPHHVPKEWIDRFKGQFDDDRFIERADPSLRPSLIAGRTDFTYFPGATRIPESSSPYVKNRSHSITAYVDVPPSGGDGVLVAAGGFVAGYVLYVKDGKPTYEYNWFAQQRYKVTSVDKLSPGPATIRVDFKYDGGGVAKGGLVSLFVNDKKVGEGRVEKTVAGRFSADETFDVGMDTGSPVSEDYKSPNPYTGTLRKVQIKLQPTDHSENDIKLIRKVERDVEFAKE
jgi:hypothetical protein